ncbi:hypothetical protein [Enterovibrio coralii]|uniref:hypothetical protein n=1 Tax=Enterovibrio coralii TaxID=294935 RepID=UPI001E50EC3A|nr:hypothetical protein [Enterovibrio coralii]
MWKGASIDSSVSAEQLASLYSMTTPVFEKTTPKGKGDIYYGKITLPYFLDIKKENYLSSPWQSGMPSVAKIRHILEEGTEADKQAVHAQLAALNIDVQDIAEFENNTDSKRRLIDALSGNALTLANGSPVDSERLMTRFSVLPTLRSVQTIDYSLTIPNLPECQERGANAITIYQHGVTSDKGSFEKSQLSDALLTDQCRAIFAINHPLHGDRGIDGKNAGSDPEMYLNLSSLTTARDNLRQSTIDVINFRAAIGLMAEKVATATDPEAEYGKLATISMDNGVGYAGHSLGAITGINAGSAVSNTLNSAETDEKYFALNKLALASPGAEIPYLLLNSTMFSPLIKGNIALKVNEDFANQCGGKHWMELLFCYGSYEKKLVNNGSPESLSTLRELYDSYDHFAFAAQTVMDTVDPTNHARLISPALPVYMQQVNGDSIIPNEITEGDTLAGTDILVPYSPFAGTKPLVQNLNIEVTTASVSATPIKNAALFKFFGAGHSSVLANDKKKGTEEMQKQMQSFVQGDGNTLTVTNASVLEE